MTDAKSMTLDPLLLQGRHHDIVAKTVWLQVDEI